MEAIKMQKDNKSNTFCDYDLADIYKTFIKHEKPPRFRSRFERNIAESIMTAGFVYKYEELRLKFIQPAKKRTYTLDFVLPNGIIVEVKGLWSREDRQKHLLIKRQYPNLDIRFIFSNPQNKLYKGSKTTYADFCCLHGILYAQKNIPLEWLD